MNLYKILIFLSSYNSSAILGVLGPLAHLEKAGRIEMRIRFTGNHLYENQDIDWCDLAVFSRACEPKELKILDKLLDLGRPVVYEIDDNYFEIPLSLPIGVYHRTPARLFTAYAFASKATATHVYSSRLLDKMTEMGVRPKLVKSYFDIPRYGFNCNTLSRVSGSHGIKIAFASSRSDNEPIERELNHAFLKILECCDSTEIHLWRAPSSIELRSHSRVKVHKPLLNYEQYIEYFKAQKIDIGLAPGDDSPFFQSKTNNKYREYGGMQVAGIYYNGVPYSECIVDGKNGLLVDGSSAQWFNAINMLVNSPGLRSSIIENALNDVSQNYSIDACSERWISTLSEVMHDAKHRGKVSSFSVSNRFVYSLNICPDHELGETAGYLSRSLLTAASNLGIVFVDLQSVHSLMTHRVQGERRAIYIYGAYVNSGPTLSVISKYVDIMIIDFARSGLNSVAGIINGVSNACKIHVISNSSQCQYGSDFTCPDENLKIAHWCVHDSMGTDIEEEYSMLSATALYMKILYESNPELPLLIKRSSFRRVFKQFVDSVYSLREYWWSKIFHAWYLLRFRIGSRSF